MFRGVLTALVTPFRDGEIDQPALRELVDRQIEAGIHGLVVCGTTGEAASMNESERLLAIRLTKEQAKGRVPVVAGTGSNNTRQSVAFTQKAAELGIDGALVVTPYYVKPPQRGLLQHMQAVANVGVPIVAYNVPSRTGVSITPQTAGELATIEQVVSIKEASADLGLGSRIIQAVDGRLSILSGDDFTFLPLLSIGGLGCISVTSNVAPALMASIYDKFIAGDLPGARASHYKLLPLMTALFLESNPIGAKAALAMLDQISWEIRPPLAKLADTHHQQLADVLNQLSL